MSASVSGSLGFLPAVKVCREQGVLESLLAALKLGPMQQSVGVEGVIDPLAPCHLEVKSEFLAARTQRLATALKSAGAAPYFFLQVLGDVLAGGAHARIELKWLKMDVRRHIAADAEQCSLERLQANDAPRTGDVRNKIDPDAFVH
jgi:hypothetical protein